MCNYGEVRELKAKEAGLNEGALNMAVDNVYKLHTKTKYSLNDVLDLLEIKDDIKDRVIEEVRKKIS